MGLIIGPNCVQAKNVKSWQCQMREINSMSRGIPLLKTSATHYNAQLEHPDNGRAIKRLIVCYVMLLGSMKGKGLRTYA